MSSIGTPLPPVRPRECRTLERVFARGLTPQFLDSSLCRLAAWCLRVSPRLAGLIAKYPKVVREGSWRLGPAVENRLPGAPTVILDNLRVNEKTVRLELSVYHHARGSDSAQASEAQQVSDTCNLIDIVRRSAQVVDTTAFNEVPSGVVSISMVSDRSDGGADGSTPDATTPSPKPQSAQDEPEPKTGGIAGAPGIDASTTSIRQCATHDGPANSSTGDQWVKRKGYKIEPSAGVEAFDAERDARWGGSGIRWKTGQRPVLDDLARSAVVDEAANVGQFEGQPVDEAEIARVEQVVTEWVMRVHGRTQRWTILARLSRLLWRLRRLAGCDLENRRAALAEIGLEARDEISGSWGSVRRVCPHVAEVSIPGQERVKLLSGKRVLRFVDYETGETEVREMPGSLRWEEQYALTLVKVILDEVSRR